MNIKNKKKVKAQQYITIAILTAISMVLIKLSLFLLEVGNFFILKILDIRHYFAVPKTQKLSVSRLFKI